MSIPKSLKLDILNQQLTKVGEKELNPAIFGVEINQGLVHQVVVAQMANSRTVLAHTKDRSEVKGGGRKPWRQKGTGRARAGSIRSPLWKGGGVTFGPTKDRNFSQKINKKMRRKAVFMCLSDRLNDQRLVLLDRLEQPQGKTKYMREFLDSLIVKLYPKELDKKTRKGNIKITYFVHGATIDNEQHKSTGWHQGILSELGKRQNIELRETIKKRGDRYNIVFCSDLARARETAKTVFAGSQAKIIADKRLRECNYGELNGQPSQEFNDKYYYIDNKHPKGENYKDVEKRIKEFLDEISKKYRGKKIAFVAHCFTQFALEVITKNKTWQQAINEDWRNTKKWQPGWNYEYSNRTIKQSSHEKDGDKQKDEVRGETKKKLDKFSMLIILDKPDKNIIRSVKNIPGLKVDTARNLNVVDILKYKYLLMVEPATQVIENTFLGSINKNQLTINKEDSVGVGARDGEDSVETTRRERSEKDKQPTTPENQDSSHKENGASQKQDQTQNQEKTTHQK